MFLLSLSIIMLMYLILLPNTDTLILKSTPTHQAWVSRSEFPYWKLNIYLSKLDILWVHDMYAYEENAILSSARDDLAYIENILTQLFHPVYIQLPEGYYGVLYPEYGALYDPKLCTWFKATDIFELSYLHRHLQDNPTYHLFPIPEGYDKFKLYVLSSKYN